MTKIDDDTHLRHMLDAATRAERMSREETRNSLETDEKFSLAIVRLLEIIGEAATHVSAESKAQLSTLPWPQIVGMRNRIVHV
ncbi:MAG: HepT-like ribonuclease domain-containing protein [Cyanobacteria bacterium P01_H01_bin.152]